jgi:3-methylfumaryl-CoA hydratase
MLTPNFAEWIGRSQTVEGTVDVSLAQMLHATLAAPGFQAPRGGDPLPALWHWSAFSPKVTMDKLSRDGHPQRGDFLPPVNLPRRMWAGGAVTFHADLHVGAALEQVSTIKDVAVKSESMVFVTVLHDVFEGGRPVLSETQNIVYLEIPDTYTPPRAKPVPTENVVFDTPVPLSEAMLFRYSAATFNAHRIHYDLAYASEVEKYPGLVVHGPLQATLLMGAATAQSGRRPAQFTYRGVHPMFHSDPLRLMGFDATQAGMSLCTGVPGAHRGMEATVLWEEITT